MQAYSGARAVFFAVRLLFVLMAVVAIAAVVSASVDGSRRSVWIGRAVLAAVVLLLLVLSIVRE